MTQSLGLKLDLYWEGISDPFIFTAPTRQGGLFCGVLLVEFLTLYDVQAILTKKP